MSTVSLGILRMPPSCWSGDEMDVFQRHQTYKWAADEIERLRPGSECGWEWDTANSLWTTGCGEEFECSQSDEACDLYVYCPYCGGKIVEESSSE